MREAGWTACATDEDGVSFPTSQFMKESSAKENFLDMAECLGVMAGGTKANGSTVKCMVEERRSVLIIL